MFKWAFGVIILPNLTMFATGMEKLMQYIWQHRLWNPSGISTVDGRSVRIIDPGLLNTGSGPDFFNAKIYIGDDLWVGNVEVHVRASDWKRHGHDKDRAYDSVILHVVDKDDMAIRRIDGQVIPQLRMPCSAEFAARCQKMLDQARHNLPCATIIPQLPKIYLTDWISSLGYERLYRKSEHLVELSQRLRGDWEEVAYITLSRAMGFGVNNDTFERLAMSLPAKFMRKHADSLMAVEALLMGQAGLLPLEGAADPYAVQLINEYRFLAHKFGLHPLPAGAWKLGHMRPWNFPHRRIATLAEIIHRCSRIMSSLIELRDEETAREFFSFGLSGYWSNHYRFGAPSPHIEKAVSVSTVRLLMINAVIPLIHAYATTRGDQELVDRAVELLQSLKPESNSIVKLFTDAGIECRDAFTSQALIQLRREYCEPRKCLYCRIGHRLLATHATR